MKRASAPRGSRRGAVAVVGLVLSMALALGAVLIFGPSSPSLPARPALSSEDPWTRAKLAFADGDWKAAEDLLRPRTDVPARKLLGRVLLERGRADEASRLFGQILKDDPSSFDATRGLALASEALGRGDLAVLYWSRAAELRKDDAGVWRSLALSQERQGDSLGAMASLRQAMALDPGRSDLASLTSELATGGSRIAGQALQLPGPASSEPAPIRPLDPGAFPNRPRPIDPLYGAARPRPEHP